MSISLGGDETVVTKAGKHTHGLDRFFASLYGKSVPGLAFFTLSLISTQQRRSFPIALEQVLRSAEEKAAAQAKQEDHTVGCHAETQAWSAQRQHDQGQNDGGTDAGTAPYPDDGATVARAHWRTAPTDLSGPGWALWH